MANFWRPSEIIVDNRVLKDPITEHILSLCPDVPVRYTESGNPQDIKNASEIIAASERMQKLIDDILSYASIRNASKKFQNIDLNKVLENVCSDLEESIIMNNAVMESDILPNIIGEQSQLEQAFQNLISNAIKFHFDFLRPVIHIKYQGLVSDPENQNQDQLASHNIYYHQIDISDNGIGFEIKDKEKIFQLFTRLHTKDAYSGSGIGLATVKHIMDLHSGKIQVTSEPGNGATFSLFFPER